MSNYLYGSKRNSMIFDRSYKLCDFINLSKYKSVFIRKLLYTYIFSLYINIFNWFDYFRNSAWCNGALGTAFAGKCGRPAGIALNSKTGDLYVADAPLGLHVIPPAGGLATKLADSVDGKPFKFLDGLDVDPTTGVVYFTSFSSKFGPR